MSTVMAVERTDRVSCNVAQCHLIAYRTNFILLRCSSGALNKCMWVCVC